ncbi:hypothetical protein MJO28_013891 [Puccinia striiformis f. sp. tritici]|uniref:Retrotransposon Copia-like N-terminal domain-containing protein n=2 Tax=Puccinia striiformis f. sp. tritici TaxID=168172 RepID=A0A0L0V7W3_9BASI|nr:hypothetical protein MJO28_013891 [Puccinia striiformis f. sp. tritici]KNE95368.1 hypothetical protein PSTG_11352 [Puccinia striiformis f. sp. tritici PST-78]
MASPKDNEREFTMEKLSGPDNFWSWRRNMLMVLTYHDLDDLVLVVDPPISQDDIEVKKKRAAALIRLHLDAQHAYQFVDDLDKFEAKELWDAISNHYASPTLKNAHDLIELLDGIRFDKGDIQDSIRKFRDIFKLLVEVSRSFFDAKTLEFCYIVMIRNQLPES